MKNRKINKSKLLCFVLIALLGGCTSTKRNDTTTQSPLLSQDGSEKVKSTARKRASKIEAPDYTEEIDAILSLARKERWSEAESAAADLLSVAPNDTTVLRVYTWVKKENTARKESELENQLRDISASGSRTNPDLKEVFLNKKTGGLQPRADLRESIEQIKNSPLIPESFGKVIESRENLYPLDSEVEKMNIILEKDITIQVSDVSLHDIIFNIGKAENINFVADQSLAAMNTKLTMNVQNWKLGKFLKYVSQNLNVNFQIGTDVIWISDGSDPAKVKTLEEVKCFKLKHGFILPAQFGASKVTTTAVTANNVTTTTQNEVRERFVRDGAPLSPSIESAISTFFEGSKYQIDRERNLIIARGTYQQLATLEEIIEAFDKPVQQVYIEARFITVSEAAFLQLGVDWSTVAQTSIPTAVDYTGMGATYGLGAGLTKTWTKIFGTDDLNATLYAIEQSGESETLSSPRIVAVNNLPATIEDGQVQYYYEQYTVTQQVLENRSSATLVPSETPTKLTSGVKLDVLASVGGDGETILLALSPEVNSDVRMTEFTSVTDYDSDGKPFKSFSIKLPQFNTQKLSTRVAVKSGQTVAMGGVMERKQETFSESVPVLSSIPLIGNFFRKRSEIDKPRYLLIFVTATVISDSGEFVIPQ
ncbi:MAG: type II secretion system protein GspD [Verrucomicrobia bacterium]|nr:type II secretion system protein GspD [Verrucomicrobiota bacterium]